MTTMRHRRPHPALTAALALSAGAACAQTAPTDDPRVWLQVSAYRPSVDSSFRLDRDGGALNGTDIDGEPWASPPSIGCDEYHVGAVTGPLNVGIVASLTNVAMGFTVQLTALLEGRIAASSWDFGDGTTATNQPYASHAWAAPGNYAVVLRAFNESQAGGISATVTLHVVNAVHHVAAA